jgi:hypothetical protein
MGGYSNRGRDEACSRVLSVEDDGIDGSVVVVQPLPDVSLRMIHFGQGELYTTRRARKRMRRK